MESCEDLPHPYFYVRESEYWDNQQAFVGVTCLSVSQEMNEAGLNRLLQTVRTTAEVIDQPH